MRDSIYAGMLRTVVQIPAQLALLLIRGYQFFLSPWMGRACRFTPTCSHYSYEAIQRFGMLRGGWMAVRRIGRCHPWHEGGWDPVPEQDGSVATPKQSCTHHHS